MRHLPILALSACVLAACAPDASPEDALTSTEQAVYLGQPNPGDPAVVALTYFGSSFCSGTLIAPRVVLSAAHCLPPNGGDFSEISVFFGADTSGPGDFVAAVDGWRNPFWNDNTLYYDVGLLRLAEDAPVAPMAWHDEGDAYGLGDPARIVGFGIIGEDQGGGGLKREGTALVDDLDPHVMTLTGDPSGTCSGDSGGATIMDLAGVDTLVGVTLCQFKDIPHIAVVAKLYALDHTAIPHVKAGNDPLCQHAAPPSSSAARRSIAPS